MERDEDSDYEDRSKQGLRRHLSFRAQLQQRPITRARSQQRIPDSDGEDDNGDTASQAVSLALMNAYRDRERHLTAQMGQLRQANDDLREQLDECSARLEDVEAARLEAEDTVRRLKKDTTTKDQQKQLDEMRVELRAKSAELEESQRGKENLASQLAKKTAELQKGASSSAALVFFTAQLAQKSNEVTAARQEIESLKLIAELEHQKVEEDRQRIETLERELARAKQDVATARQDQQSIAALRRENAQLKQQLETTRRAGGNGGGDDTAIGDYVEHTMQENESLREVVNALNAELDGAQQQIATLRLKDREHQEERKRFLASQERGNPAEAREAAADQNPPNAPPRALPRRASAIDLLGEQVFMPTPRAREARDAIRPPQPNRQSDGEASDGEARDQ